MGDRDYRSVIKGAIESIGREIEPKFDKNDFKNIQLHEVVSCLRRSYYNRIDPIERDYNKFSDLLSGLVRKMQYGTEEGKYDIKGVNLVGSSDMIVDDTIVLFRSTEKLPESPMGSDILYLNGCMWIFDKMDAILIYLTGDRQETSFSLSKNTKMFEETSRRAKVLTDLLQTKKLPILEPSPECSNCQYYSRCFIDKKIGRSVSLKEMIGLK